MSALNPGHGVTGAGAGAGDAAGIEGGTGCGQAAPVGRVALVGAGPGDPGLLTLRAARLLAEADVVVHDALVGAGVMALIPTGTERIDVGKRPGRATPQELISTTLVHLARQGLMVVRLKGGDPFVFGRGGEEALELQRAGIEVEVVPGISSSVAAPAAAGIPVTHRGVSPSYTVVTGHRRPGETPVDWRAMAKVGGTIAILMVEWAKVAAVHAATTLRQEVVRCRLDELGCAAVRSPAVIVVGAVAALDIIGADAVGVTPGRSGHSAN